MTDFDGHMSAAEFRRQGYAMIDRIADYMEEVERYPVLSQVQPGQVRSGLSSQAPEAGQSFDEIMADLDQVIMPGITHWQSPNFFAYFPANTSGPSILGELLCAGLGVQGMLWATSPACTELESQVLDWLVDMLGLRPEFKSTSEGGGVIQDSASSAVLCALLAARERTTMGESNRRGVTDRKLIAYASTQTHSSLEKAVRIAGIGSEQLRLIEVDETYAMRADGLAEAIEQDLARGLQPFFVCATVGTTSSTAVDPLSEIGEICQREGLWLHVDAALAGSAAVCPEFRGLHKGVEHADSYCFNPHKWLLTNFDCDCLYVADRRSLTGALAILPEYLKNNASEVAQVIDYRDWQVPLGRRFRALKLWFVIRYYGQEGLRAYIREHIRIAAELAQWVEQDAAFELAAPVNLNLVCFRHMGGDDVNRDLLDKLNASGKIYLTHTVLDGKITLRLSIGGTYTQFSHVQSAWALIKQMGQE